MLPNPPAPGLHSRPIVSPLEESEEQRDVLAVLEAEVHVVRNAAAFPVAELSNARVGDIVEGDFAPLPAQNRNGFQNNGTLARIDGNHLLHIEDQRNQAYRKNQNPQRQNRQAFGRFHAAES